MQSKGETFSVGDCVRIRTWDDMKMEFGLTSYGAIDCKFTFTNSMKVLCGREFTITEILSDGNIKGHDFGTKYWISRDMLEHAVETVFDTEDIDNFLGSIIIN